MPGRNRTMALPLVGRKVRTAEQEVLREVRICLQIHAIGEHSVFGRDG